jgi:hypothetical protein
MFGLESIVVADLFSYCVRYDAGSAPNPFWGVCTLVICKPRIRLAAEVGDWVIGTGSRRSPQGDLSGRVVYAMQIGRKLTMSDYDEWTANECPEKVPDCNNSDHRRVVGDSVYDFSSRPPRQRRGVHMHADRRRDLSGQFALLAERFVYFGQEATELPPSLDELVKQGPGHRRIRDGRLIRRFEKWFARFGRFGGALLGWPSRWPQGASTSPEQPPGNHRTSTWPRKSRGRAADGD